MAVILLLTATSSSHAEMVEAHWITEAYHISGGGLGGNYNNASVSVYIDPSVTNWIAWHDLPVPDVVGGQEYVGDYGNWIGVDDYLDLTITTPGGSFFEREMDWNSSMGSASGHQAVIFGAAAEAPNVRRWNLYGTDVYFDLDGLFNDVFTTAGTYTFDFAFFDAYAGSYGNPDMYLLVEIIPEPAVLSLLSLGGLLAIRGRR